MKRPTPLPLTRTERDALDGLIRRGARALSPAEGNRLLRLWQLDQAERLQERRTARGLDKLNRELRRRLKEAEAEVRRQHADCQTAEARLAAVLGIAGCSAGAAETVPNNSGDEVGDALRRLSADLAQYREGTYEEPAWWAEVDRRRGGDL